MKKALWMPLLVLSLVAFTSAAAFSAKPAGKTATAKDAVSAGTAVASTKPKAVTNAASKPKPVKPQAAKAKTGKEKTAKGSGKVKGKKAALPRSDWSPNNFPAGSRGWCTWYADGRFRDFHGEKLELFPRPNSNAHTWYKRAQNLARTYEGVAGDIMVIKRPKGDRTGHVAFVEESVPGEYWIVTHSNFDFRGHQPLKTEMIDGRKVFTDVFVPGPKSGTVMLKGGSSVYNLLGFLHKDKPAPAISPEPLIETGVSGAVAAAPGEGADSSARTLSGGPGFDRGYATLNKTEAVNGTFFTPDACGPVISTKIAL